MANGELPIPPHFDPAAVGEIWKVDYESRAKEAETWSETHHISPAHEDGFRVKGSNPLTEHYSVLGPEVMEDPRLARKVYLLEDCTSPVVVPGVARSTDPMDSWPGLSF